MKKLLLPILLLLAALSASAAEPIYFEAGDLKYQYFDGEDYYAGGLKKYDWATGKYITIDKVGDVCILAANPDYTGTDLVIPETVPYNGKNIKVVGIAPEAFANNEHIQSVTFPNTFPADKSNDFYNANTQNKLCGKNMFAGCTNLSKVTFSDGMNYFVAQTPFTGCPIAQVETPEQMTSLGEILEGCAATTIQLPEWITEVSFKKCAQLTEIPYLPAMTVIPQSAFAYCSSLVNPVLPPNAETISRFAFDQCSNLETLVIPDKVKVLAQGAFSNCQKLEKVVVGSSVNQFESSVFAGSDAIAEIEFKPTTAPRYQEVGNPTATAATAHIFDDAVYESAVATVPEGSLNGYKAQGWFKFAHVEDTTTGIDEITVEGNAPAEYFNLQGMQVSADALRPGIYIKCQGTSTSKFIVR